MARACLLGSEHQQVPGMTAAVPWPPFSLQPESRAQLANLKLPQSFRNGGQRQGLKRGQGVGRGMWFSMN